MSNLNFEEYRQPWETGPHWELKREFMEKYQNDFPEDRLLCLAQAYSNIELLHCSYPDPVMLQIHELSKSLHGCKRFRDADKLKEKERNSSQRASKSKRNLPNKDSNKSFKFIKFCSAVTTAGTVDNSQSSLNRKPIFDHVPDANSDYLGNKTCNSSNVIDTHHSAKTVDDSQSSENKISNIVQVPDSNSDNLGNKDIDIHHTDVSCKSIDDSTNFVLHLTNSPDFKEIKTVADGMKSNHRKRKPYEEVEIAVCNLNVENLASYKFYSSSIEKMPVCSCTFYIGNTLVSIGRDNNQRNALIKAAEYAVEILSNLDNLPCKTLSDLKTYWLGKNVDFPFQHKDCCRKKTPNINSVEENSSCTVVGNEINEKGTDLDESSLHFWLKLAQEVKKHVGKNLLASKILESAAKSIDTSKMFYFNFNEELNTPLSCRIFCCSLVVEKTVLCQGKDSSKKKAKSKASENGVICMVNLIKWHEEHFEHFQEFGEILGSLNAQHSKENFKRESSSKYSEAKESILHYTNLCDIASNSEINKSGEPPLFKTLAELKAEFVSERKKIRENINQKRKDLIKKDVESLSKTCEDNTVILSSESKESTNENIRTKPFIFTLNKKLLHNSYSKQLVVFDTSAINPVSQQSPGALLNYSASFCQKQMTYDADEILSASGGTEKFRFHLRFDGEVIGIGEALTKMEAKANAAFYALENLKKSVYTIKVKNELEDGFVIKRSQVINVNFSSNVVSDNNIGRKMLKMMGWSGGGIGKKGGITEPIVASDHQFHQGLGFSNNSGNMRNFKQKIDALLKDFSQSNTTGDLIFATDFSKDERKDIHRMAVKYNLNSNSRGGKNKPRQLFVRRKMSVNELLNLIVQAGGSTSKYELVDCS